MDTNPQGSAKTVSQAANAFLGMMEPEEAQAQPRVQQELESDVVEDEYEADDSAEYDADEVQEEEPTPTYRVKVGKDELDVPLDELLKGYSRTADYTRKTQEIAETRKAVEADRAKIEEAARLRDTYAQRLSVIEQMLNQDPGEDLATLKEHDPIGYAVKVAEQSEREKQLNAVRAEQQRLAQQQQAEQGERLKAHLATEAQKLAEAIPEISDPVKGQAIRTDIRNYAQKLGFSEQELAQVYDSRAVTALYKAMQYDKLVSNKGEASKKVNQAPRMLRPGTSAPETRTSQEVKNMRGRLKKSGRAKDAAALFERFL
jgi:hypothetical protein